MVFMMLRATTRFTDPQGFRNFQTERIQFESRIGFYRDEVDGCGPNMKIVRQLSKQNAAADEHLGEDNR